MQELGHQATVIRKVADEVFAESGLTLKYKIGTMIEIPRAALVADEVNNQTSDLRLLGYFACINYVFTCIWCCSLVCLQKRFSCQDSDGFYRKLIKLSPLHWDLTCKIKITMVVGIDVSNTKFVLLGVDVRDEDCGTEFDMVKNFFEEFSWNG